MQLSVQGQPIKSKGEETKRFVKAMQEASRHKNLDSFAAALSSLASPVDWASFPWDEDTSQDAMYRCALLQLEFPTATGATSWKHWIHQGLERLRILETQFCQAIETSKARDDKRGAATIPHYAAAHVAAAKDPVIVRAKEQLRTVQGQIEDVLLQLQVSTL